MLLTFEALEVVDTPLMINPNQHDVIGQRGEPNPITSAAAAPQGISSHRAQSHLARSRTLFSLVRVRMVERNMSSNSESINSQMYC